VLCHRAKVAKTFRCCSHRLCFLQCDWWRGISLHKVINVNEARGNGRMSPDPLLLGGVCAWEGYGRRKFAATALVCWAIHMTYIQHVNQLSPSQTRLSIPRGGRTRSRAANIADIAFISLWYLHRAKKHMTSTNSCVFQTVLKLSAKYKLYTCRSCTAHSRAPVLSWLLGLVLGRDCGDQQPTLNSSSKWFSDSNSVKAIERIPSTPPNLSRVQISCRHSLESKLSILDFVLHCFEIFSKAARQNLGWKAWVWGYTGGGLMLRLTPKT